MGRVSSLVQSCSSDERLASKGEGEVRELGGFGDDSDDSFLCMK